MWPTLLNTVRCRIKDHAKTKISFLNQESRKSIAASCFEWYDAIQRDINRCGVLISQCQVTHGAICSYDNDVALNIMLSLAEGNLFSSLS